MFSCMTRGWVLLRFKLNRGGIGHLGQQVNEEGIESLRTEILRAQRILTLAIFSEERVGGFF